MRYLDLFSGPAVRLHGESQKRYQMIEFTEEQLETFITRMADHRGRENAIGVTEMTREWFSDGPFGMMINSDLVIRAMAYVARERGALTGLCYCRTGYFLARTVGELTEILQAMTQEMERLAVEISALSRDFILLSETFTELPLDPPIDTP